MSVYDPDTVEGKMARGGGPGARTTGTVGGTGTFGLGGGAGGGFGASVAPGAAGDPTGLKSLIRKRLLAARGAPYAAATAPQTPGPTPVPDGFGAGLMSPIANPTDMPPTGAPASQSPSWAQSPAATMSSLLGMTGLGSRLSPGGGGLLRPNNPGPGQGPQVDANGVPLAFDFHKDPLGAINTFLREFIGSGAFSPGASPAIMAGVRGNALADAEAARARAALAAQSMGADPATAASYALQSDLRAQGDVSRSMGDASLGELTHQRDFGQQLMMALLGKQATQGQVNPGKTGWSYLQDIGQMAAPWAGGGRNP